jgi:APA family basic amino acid/polyamine antiporter
MKEDAKIKVSRIDKGSMQRVLGVSDLFAVGYGDLGSSIYYALGITALYALGATPIAFILAGFVFACTALTYAEMSSVISEAGGSASYSRKAFNDLVSFFAGWALLLDYIVTIAISAFSVGPYLKFFFSSFALNDVNIAFTIILIAALLLLNIIGTKHSTRLSFILTFLTIITQIVIIVVGVITLVNFPKFFHNLAINQVGNSFSPTWPQFWKGVAMAMVAYTGIESMAQLSSEARSPGKTVPKAILIAMGTLLLMYLGISLVALSAMTPQILSTQYLTDPLSGIVAAIPHMGSWLGPWVGILGAILLIVASNAGLIGASRVSYNLSEYCQLPRFFYALSSRKTPYISLIIFGVLASGIVVWSRGSLAFLADLYNFGAMLAFFSAHMSLIFHRIKHPTMQRPFKIPLNIKFKNFELPITAIIGALATISVWIMVIVTKPEGRWLGLGWLVLGTIIYAAYRKNIKIGITENVSIQNLKVEDFKNLNIKKILVPIRSGVIGETMQVACEFAKSVHAEVTALNVIEVPFVFPLDSPLFHKPTGADAILEKAEAIGREYGLAINLKQMLARSVSAAILEMVRDENYSLILMGYDPSESKRVGVGPIIEKVLKEAKCKVWVCKKGESVEKFAYIAIESDSELEQPIS